MGGGLLVVAVCLAVLSQSHPVSRSRVARIGAAGVTDAPAAPAPFTAGPAAAPGPNITTVQRIAQSAVGLADGNGMTVEKADPYICLRDNPVTGDPEGRWFTCPPQKFRPGMRRLSPT